MKTKTFNVKQFLGKNSVPILFILICAVLIPVSGLPVNYIINEAVTRLGRNSFLILSLLIPIMAGMGLNFGMTLGAMAGEIGLIFVADWQIWGIPGLVLAAIISIPISIGLGVFNLIPIPPLDGSKVLAVLLPDRAYSWLMRYERYGGLVLMVLMMTGVLGKPVSTIVSAIYSNLIPVAQFACDLVVKLFYK